MGKFAWCIMMLFLWKPNETKHVGGASINYSPLSLIILSYSHGLKFVKLCLSENRLPNRLPHLLIFMFFIELAGSIWFRYPLYPSVSTIFRHQIPSQIPRHHHVARPRLGTSGQEFSGPRQWPPDHPSASCSSERPGRRGMGMDGMPWVMAFFLCFSMCFLVHWREDLKKTVIFTGKNGGVLQTRPFHFGIGGF